MMKTDKIMRTIKINLTQILTDHQKEILDDMFLSLSSIYATTLKKAKELRTVSSVVLNKELYYEIKNDFPNIPTAYIQSIRNSVIGSLKSFNTNNPNKRFQIKEYKGVRKTIPLDKRTFSQRGNLFTFSTTEKRFRLMLNIPEWFQQRYPKKELCAGTITKRKGEYYLNILYKINSEISQTGNDVVGIDRGIYNLVALSTGELFESKKIRETQRKYLYNRKTLQQKGTKSAKRKLKKISGKEKRFMRDVNHCISKKLSQNPNVKTYVLEDLTGIRKERKGKKLNKWISSWSFFQLETFLDYKCQLNGISVVKVSPKYTSQTCNICGTIDKENRQKNHFVCKSCGYKDNADLNAAKNIRDKYLLSLVRGTGCFQPAECFGEQTSGTIPTPCGLGS